MRYVLVSSHHYWKALQKDKNKNGAQIDILLVRDDDVIDIIECKFYSEIFVIDKAYSKKLQNKENLFLESSAYKGSTNIILMTIHGVEQNNHYRDTVTNNITIDSLF